MIDLIDLYLPMAVILAMGLFVFPRTRKIMQQRLRGRKYKDALLFDRIGGAWTCIKQVKWIDFDKKILTTKIGDIKYKFELRDDFGYWDKDGRLKIRFDINQVLPLPDSRPKEVWDAYLKTMMPTETVQANGGDVEKKFKASPIPNVEIKLGEDIDHPIVIAAKTEADVIEHTYGGKWNKFLMIMCIVSLIALVVVVFIFAGLPNIFPQEQVTITTSQPPVVVP